MTDDTQIAEAPADRFRRLAGTFSATVDAVPDNRWDSPSPCDGWAARDLVRHVTDTYASVLGRAGLELPEGPSLDDDPAAAWAHGRDAVQGILDDPVKSGAEYDAFGGRSKVGDTFGSFMSVDLVVHRWDLARAAGLPDAIPARDLAFVRAFAEQMGDMGRASGAFGPEVAVPDDADEQTRLLGFLGRSSA